MFKIARLQECKYIKKNINDNDKKNEKNVNFHNNDKDKQKFLKLTVNIFWWATNLWVQNFWFGLKDPPQKLKKKPSVEEVEQECLLTLLPVTRVAGPHIKFCF